MALIGFNSWTLGTQGGSQITIVLVGGDACVPELLMLVMQYPFENSNKAGRLN